jgi:AcrR family transcriptional regulator
VRCAIDLFATNGFAATTTDAIGAAAGVAHGTVFLYFPTKGALFAAAVLEPLVDLKQAFRIGPTRGPVVPLLSTMVAAHVSLIVERESYIRLVTYVLGQSERFPELARDLTEFGLQTATDLAALVARGQRAGELHSGDPQSIAVSYLAFLQGLAITVREPADHRIWSGIRNAGLRLFGPRDSSRTAR